MYRIFNQHLHLPGWGKLLLALILNSALLLLPLQSLAGVTNTSNTDSSPTVVVTIAPLHSLVAGLMVGVGEPHLLLDSALSVHDYSLKPSDAKQLAAADMVVQIGPSLEGFLQKSITTIAQMASIVALADADNATRLEARDFHHHTEGHADTHVHAGGIDPHMWLDPQNALAWIDVLTEELQNRNPDNRDIYARNRDSVQRRLVVLQEDMSNALAATANAKFIALHDSFQYLENRFQLGTAGAMLDSNEQRIGVASLRRLSKLSKSAEIRCLVSSPETRESAFRSLTGGVGVKAVEVDILGSQLEPGADLYFQMMQGVAERLAACLSQ